jgi:hypothetical protein
MEFVTLTAGRRRSASRTLLFHALLHGSATTPSSPPSPAMPVTPPTSPATTSSWTPNPSDAKHRPLH